MPATAFGPSRRTRPAARSSATRIAPFRGSRAARVSAGRSSNTAYTRACTPARSPRRSHAVGDASPASRRRTRRIASSNAVSAARRRWIPRSTSAASSGSRRTARWTSTNLAPLGAADDVHAPAQTTQRALDARHRSAEGDELPLDAGDLPSPEARHVGQRPTPDQTVLIPNFEDDLMVNSVLAQNSHRDHSRPIRSGVLRETKPRHIFIGYPLGPSSRPALRQWSRPPGNSTSMGAASATSAVRRPRPSCALALTGRPLGPRGP